MIIVCGVQIMASNSPGIKQKSWKSPAKSFAKMRRLSPLQQILGLATLLPNTSRLPFAASASVRMHMFSMRCIPLELSAPCSRFCFLRPSSYFTGFHHSRMERKTSIQCKAFKRAHLYTCLPCGVLRPSSKWPYYP